MFCAQSFKMVWLLIYDLLWDYQYFIVECKYHYPKQILF